MMSRAVHTGRADPRSTSCKTLPEAQAFGAAIGDGRTMIYAVTGLGHSAHITNA
jgi:hypothetical protein